MQTSVASVSTTEREHLTFHMPTCMCTHNQMLAFTYVHVCTHKLVKCVLSLVGFCSGLSIWSGRDDMCAGSDREWSGFQCFKMSNSPREHRHDIVVGSKSHGTKDGEGDWGL